VNKEIKALGIDPGTKSFDLVVIEGEKVVAEESLETEEVARDPSKLVKVVDRLGPVDIIAGPSGYGTPVVCNKDIIDPRRFALEILLLTPEEELRKGLKRGHAGIAVYKALADVVEELWRKELNVCYIPSVILLPTVPFYRKVNKIDMGTADKLAVTALAIYDFSREHGVNYNEANLIVVEMGYGYNAVIGVKEGKVVDGMGGTLVSPGFLTAGSLDFEVAVAGRCWERSDVFEGGVSSICDTTSLEEFISNYSSSDRCYWAFKALIEGIYKSVASIKASVPEAKEILISGRLARYKEVYEEVAKVLERFGSVRRIKGLRGARISKEAGQGYAMIGEGLLNGQFKELVDILEIKKAKGTVADWIFHPRLETFKKMIREAYRASLRNPERFLS
jgi:predicted butyrate kinase (DUF1464 family)